MEIGIEKASNSLTLFVNKFQPLYFNDFEIDNEMITILNTFIKIDNLNILFIGDIGSGKTCFLNALIREYYKNYTIQQYESNLLHINSFIIECYINLNKTNELLNHLNISNLSWFNASNLKAIIN